MLPRGLACLVTRSRSVLFADVHDMHACAEALVSLSSVLPVDVVSCLAAPLRRFARAEPRLVCDVCAASLPDDTAHALSRAQRDSCSTLALVAYTMSACNDNVRVWQRLDRCIVDGMRADVWDVTQVRHLLMSLDERRGALRVGGANDARRTPRASHDSNNESGSHGAVWHLAADDAAAQFVVRQLRLLCSTTTPAEVAARQMPPLLLLAAQLVFDVGVSAAVLVEAVAACAATLVDVLGVGTLGYACCILNRAACTHAALAVTLQEAADRIAEQGDLFTALHVFAFVVCHDEQYMSSEALQWLMERIMGNDLDVDSVLLLLMSLAHITRWQHVVPLAEVHELASYVAVQVQQLLRLRAEEGGVGRDAHALRVVHTLLVQLQQLRRALLARAACTTTTTATAAAASVSRLSTESAVTNAAEGDANDARACDGAWPAALDDALDECADAMCALREHIVAAASLPPTTTTTTTIVGDSSIVQHGNGKHDMRHVSSTNDNDVMHVSGSGAGGDGVCVAAFVAELLASPLTSTRMCTAATELLCECDQQRVSLSAADAVRVCLLFAEADGCSARTLRCLRAQLLPNLSALSLLQLTACLRALARCATAAKTRATITERPDAVEWAMEQLDMAEFIRVCGDQVRARLADGMTMACGLALVAALHSLGCRDEALYATIASYLDTKAAVASAEVSRHCRCSAARVCDVVGVDALSRTTTLQRFLRDVHTHSSVNEATLTPLQWLQLHDPSYRAAPATREQLAAMRTVDEMAATPCDAHDMLIAHMHAYVRQMHVLRPDDHRHFFVVCAAKAIKADKQLKACLDCLLNSGAVAALSGDTIATVLHSLAAVRFAYAGTVKQMLRQMRAEQWSDMDAAPLVRIASALASLSIRDAATLKCLCQRLLSLHAFLTPYDTAVAVRALCALGCGEDVVVQRLLQRAAAAATRYDVVALTLLFGTPLLHRQLAKVNVAAPLLQRACEMFTSPAQRQRLALCVRRSNLPRDFVQQTMQQLTGNTSMRLGAQLKLT